MLAGNASDDAFGGLVVKRGSSPSVGTCGRMRGAWAKWRGFDAGG